jgi:hypothetical protein
MRIYIASSWRNEFQPAIVDLLRTDGHEVYDFRNPPHGLGGFQWSEIDPDWQGWSAHKYRQLLLNSPVAAHGYLTDFRAMYSGCCTYQRRIDLFASTVEALAGEGQP